MLAKILSCAIAGFDGVRVEVEIDISAGLPAFSVVGLGDTAVQESRERVRAAVRNSGFTFPMKRLTVNLAPADLKKVGPSYDLPIAIGLLLASEQITGDVADAMFLGELGLDGQLRHTDGILPMVAAARSYGIRRVYVPREDAAEAALITSLEIIPVGSLVELAQHLNGACMIERYTGAALSTQSEPRYPVDFAHIRGQEHVKRALEVAAAGGHNMLMTGSPGAGKTMTARALVSILPPMGIDEAIEVTKLYSIAGRLARDTPLITTRPFCAPHHTTSIPGLVGGGSRIRPGLVSLAHRGVLFLDEMPEFGSKLEVLRQPLEDRVVTLSRAAGNVTYPASIMLVGAQNPCVCGWHGDPQQTCVCSPALVQRYQRRVSGPLLDRIDIHIDVPRVALDRMTEQTVGEPSSSVRARVILARTAQNRRLANSHAIANADMSSEEVRKYCVLDGTGQHLLQAAMRQLQLSARAYHRILKLARTIADLAAADSISSTHLAEALQYRPRQTTEV